MILDGLDLPKNEVSGWLHTMHLCSKASVILSPPKHAVGYTIMNIWWDLTSLRLLHLSEEDDQNDKYI